MQKNTPIQAGFMASPPIFNPAQTDQVEFAEYRADAIAREIEQRRAEGRENHGQHDAIMAEAMAYAWMLMSAMRWSREQVIQLENRLWGKE